MRVLEVWQLEWGEARRDGQRKIKGISKFEVLKFFD